MLSMHSHSIRQQEVLGATAAFDKEARLEPQRRVVGAALEQEED